MKIITLVAAAAAAVLAVPAASAAPAAAPATVTAAAFAASATANLAQHHSGWNNDRGHGRAHYRNVCTRQWRHGHSVRTCRKVRYWR
jgi:opacity protein-like surface antigen